MAWLLSNPVLDDPLDLLVYCHLPETRGTITFAKMPLPIGLVPLRQVIASRQPDQMRELNLDHPMPEVNRNSEMTLPCFFLD